jgi:UDP-N-acetylglucosamine 2-epimerase (non-hydrolysing)
MTVLGTRPEIIRLSLIIPLLDSVVEHTVIHTGQNYDEQLNSIFFDELGLRRPDRNLEARGTFGEQLGAILVGAESAIRDFQPDRVLILGDTNSGLSAVVARRLGIPVFHMEAGNRCYDDRVPEEVNRRLIDHSSTVLMPYTNRSRENLLREGFPGERVYTTGNPIKQVIDHFKADIAASDILSRLDITPGKYFLVTMHRAENVDQPKRLRDLIKAFIQLQSEFGFPIICSLHPRTASRLTEFGINTSDSGLQFLRPMGFFDFVNLERSAFCCLSDSGTVQEEACIFGVPNVTIREVTERPETVECGSNYLAGTDPETIMRAVHLVTSMSTSWNPPPEYLQPCVAEIACRIVTSYRVQDLAELEREARLAK